MISSPKLKLQENVCLKKHQLGATFQCVVSKVISWCHNDCKSILNHSIVNRCNETLFNDKALKT